MTDNAPGWQPDPTGRHDHRYWDGSAWTDNVADAGIASTDAYEVVEDQLADVYAESMGLEREKAECLAGRIAEAVRSGNLTEDESMSEIFSYFSDCDIDMSEISGN